MRLANVCVVLSLMPTSIVCLEQDNLGPPARAREREAAGGANGERVEEGEGSLTWRTE